MFSNPRHHRFEMVLTPPEWPDKESDANTRTCNIQLLNPKLNDQTPDTTPMRPIHVFTRLESSESLCRRSHDSDPTKRLVPVPCSDESTGPRIDGPCTSGPPKSPGSVPLSLRSPCRWYPPGWSDKESETCVCTLVNRLHTRIVEESPYFRRGWTGSRTPSNRPISHLDRTYPGDLTRRLIITATTLNQKDDMSWSQCLLGTGYKVRRTHLRNVSRYTTRTTLLFPRDPESSMSSRTGISSVWGLHRDHSSITTRHRRTECHPPTLNPHVWDTRIRSLHVDTLKDR